MNTGVRDALPDLLNGRLSALDAATMQAHVESCADCRDELAILREIRDARIMPPINVEKIASSIAPYAGTSTRVPRRERVSLVSRFGSLWIAAAAVLVAAGGWALTLAGNENTDVTPASSHVAVTSPAPVASPAARVSSPAPAPGVHATGETQLASLSLVGGTEGLSDSDLEQLVSDLETIEAVPSAEPQSVTLTVDEMGSDQ